MLRKMFLIGILFSGLSPLSFASFYYMGVGVGPDMAKFAEDATIKQFQNRIQTLNVKNKVELSGKGVFGTIFAGYGILPKLHSSINFYLAGELNANLSSLTHNSSNDEFVHHNFSDTQFEMNRSFGVSIIPGIVISNNGIFYGRVGYSNSHFKISSTDTSIGDTNKNLNGFRWGLGLQHAVASQVAVRLEFNQISYARTSTFTLDKNSNTSKHTSFKPITNEVEFGIVFSTCHL